MRTPLAFVVILAAAFATITLAGCASEPVPDASAGDVYGIDAGTEAGSVALAEAGAPARKGAQRVAILDHGLRMSRGMQVIPAGWTLTQNIATDPSTGTLARYELDVRGPNGELSRGLGHQNYSQMTGTTLDQVWKGMAMRGLYQEVQNVEFGALQRSAVLENLDGFRKAVEMGRQSGMSVQALEAPLRGMSGGKPVAGFAYVVHFSSPQLPGSGTVQVSLLVSPKDRLAETLRINEEMARSFEPNPAFEQRVREIGQMALRRQQQQSDQWMAQSQRLHQQRMAANKAQFDAHQQMMQDRYATNDQINQQWMDNFRNGGTTTASGSEYTGHDAFIDGIYERNTFDDPYSGQQVHTEGYYDHWYTNSQGDYIGTNDPNFNPYPLDGDWQEIKPLEPTP
ncbi:MAG TPA: hypothetical protein VF190_09875 [Rhodothermales bacterium]